MGDGKERKTTVYSMMILSYKTLKLLIQGLIVFESEGKNVMNYCWGNYVLFVCSVKVMPFYLFSVYFETLNVAKFHAFSGLVC